MSRLSEVSGPSDNDEQRVFVETQVEVCGRSAPRLLLDLPLRHPAGRHVGKLQLDVMSLKTPDSAFYYREMTAGVLACGRALANVREEAELLMTSGQRNQYIVSLLLSLKCFRDLNQKQITTSDVGGKMTMNPVSIKVMQVLLFIISHF